MLCWPMLPRRPLVGPGFTDGPSCFQAAARATVVCATPHSLAMARALSPARMRSRAILTWWSVSLGFRPRCTPRATAALRPSAARLVMRSRSSSARADRKARKPRPEGCGEVKVWFVEHLHGRAARVHTLHDPDAIHHGARRPVPLGQHQHVAGTKSINGLLKLRPALEALARGLLSEDGVASRCA